MHTSDFNKTSSHDSKVRAGIIIVSVTGLILFLGLAAYTWQLQRQIADLTAGTDDSRVYSLFAESDADGRSVPGISAASPSSAPGSGASSVPSADPFQQMELIRQQMDAMMSSVFGSASPAISGMPGLSVAPGSSLFGSHPFASLGMNQPAINLRETDDVLELVIPVQEGQEFELSTDVQEDRLTVSGTMSWQEQYSQNGMSSRRQGSSQFSRTIVLPANVDPAGMVTEHRQNEIVISLPKV
ncbi:MAG: Hsp20 family protein [Pseudohongiella sp.]|nr:Hsp20 family protein [Pseudohongiella sp.]